MSANRATITLNKPLLFDPEPERILIVMPTWVGDVVMSTPFLRAIFARFPDAEITLLLYPHLENILTGSPWAEHIEHWPGKKADRAIHRTWLKRMRARKFDLALLLPNSLRVAWIAWRVGARRRIGFARDARSFLLTDALPVPNRLGRGYEPMPLTDYYAEFAAYLGCAHPGDGMTLYTTDTDNAALDDRLAGYGISASQPLVVVCPGANFGASKCWHPERFAAVADRLVEQHGVAVVISPGPGEEGLARAISENMQHPATLIENPCVTLGELKSLIRRAALLLGNDTGPRHFARAFNTPRVTIFGPTEPRWTTSSHGGETIVRVDVPCGPCHEKVCPLPERICMDQVTVERVAEACSTHLAQPVNVSG